MGRVLPLLLLLGGFYSLFSLEIEMKEGKENGSRFATLNLRYHDDFVCIPEYDDFQEIDSIVCDIEAEPSNPVRPIKNLFFDVKLKIWKKHTKLIIIPKENTLLYSSDYDLSTIDYFKPRKNKRSAKHWVIISHQSEEPPFIEYVDKYNPDIINFPVSLKSNPFPYVGALDIDGNPIKSKQTSDISSYLQIKKSFKDEKYEYTIREIDKMLTEFPYTIFKSELLLYQLRAYFKLEQEQKIINLAKEYLRNFSADTAVPEVLLYTAFAHSRLGLMSDSHYYFDRLFTEHLDSEFRNMGFIYYGDDRVLSGKRKEGIKFYEKALYETKKLNIATKAAYRLGNIYLKSREGNTSSSYFDKIITGNPTYYDEDYKLSYQLAKDLAHLKQFKTSSDIMRIILEGKVYDETENYEPMLKDFAVWLDKSENREEAYNTYNKYLETYDYGLYDALIRENRDRLLFFRDENNNSKRFTNYNKLIDEYRLDSDIGKQAIYEKAKLMHKTEEFGMVLDMENDLRTAEKKYPEIENIIKDSALKVATKKLIDKKCEESINMMDNYSLSFDNSLDLKLYNCSMSSGKYETAEEVVKRNMGKKEESSLLDWNYRYSQILIKTGRYKEFIKSSNDVVYLMNLDRSDEYLNIYYDRYKAFKILRQDDEVIESVEKLKQYFKGSYKNLQPFKTVVNIAKKRKDDLLMERYGYQIIKLQEKLNTYVETPAIELVLITALKHQKKFQEAQEVSLKLLKHSDLKPDIRARAYYELGHSYQQLGDMKRAKESFKSSSEASPSNVWGKLSKDYLELL